MRVEGPCARANSTSHTLQRLCKFKETAAAIKPKWAAMTRSGVAHGIALIRNGPLGTAHGTMEQAITAISELWPCSIGSMLHGGMQIGACTGQPRIPSAFPRSAGSGCSRQGDEAAFAAHSLAWKSGRQGRTSSQEIRRRGLQTRCIPNQVKKGARAVVRTVAPRTFQFWCEQCRIYDPTAPGW